MPPELAIAQFVAYISLTIAGPTVALISVRFAYRQNFGWEPILFVKRHGLRGVGGNTPDPYFMTVTVEFWNRRKYPLVLRGVRANFPTLKLVDANREHNQVPGWYISTAGYMSYMQEEALAPTEHKQLEVQAPFAKRTLDDLVETITIAATYYDPLKNKAKTIKLKHRWRLK